MQTENKIIIHCDGGCRGNQSKVNVGGWGAVLQYGEHSKEIFGHAANTTNNIMELTSCIRALESIKDTGIPVEVTMDSQYVIQGINSWIAGWIKNGWKTSQKKPVENRELWEQLYRLKCQFNDIQFLKCKGHADNAGNNRADELANLAMDQSV